LEQDRRLDIRMDETMVLIERSHHGDKKAREQLVKDNMGLVWSIVKRFSGRGTDNEDLFQIGALGLIKAIDKFDTSFEVKFSTYAVPVITGEVKRFLRDDGMVKVSRSLKELSYRAYLAKEQLEKRLGRDPTVQEISKELNIPVEELTMALDASADVESLQKIIYQSDGSDISLEDRIPEEENPQERMLNRLLLEELLRYLEPQERQLIYMRYFQEMTQGAIAKKLGISQVQVSRMEKRILKKMKDGNCA